MLRNRYFGTAVHDMAAAAYRCNTTTYAPGAKIPPHAHENAYLCISTAGGFVEHADGRDREVHTHDLVFHPPGHRHRDRFAAPGGRCLNLEIVDADSIAAMERFHEPLYASDPEFRRLARALVREVSTADAGSPLAIDEILNTLWSRLGSQPLRRRGPAPAWLLAVRDRLRASYAEPLRLAELALEAGVHPTHLAREFRRQFGCSAGGYLRRCRLEAAQALLRDPDRTLADIALDLGFASQSHFTRVFSTGTGTTPAAYRRVQTLKS